MLIQSIVMPSFFPHFDWIVVRLLRLCTQFYLELESYNRSTFTHNRRNITLDLLTRPVSDSIRSVNKYLLIVTTSKLSETC